jgi:hypothetical protein
MDENKKKAVKNIRIMFISFIIKELCMWNPCKLPM